MALNYVARAVTIFETLLNRPATVAEKQRLLDAYALSAPTGATNADIAGIFLRMLRGYVIDQINHKEGQAAAAATLANNKTVFEEAP